MGRVLGLGGFVCLGKTAKTPDISTVTSALFLLEGILGGGSEDPFVQRELRISIGRSIVTAHFTQFRRHSYQIDIARSH